MRNGCPFFDGAEHRLRLQGVASLKDATPRFVLLATLGFVSAAASFEISETLLGKVEAEYGAEARERIVDWRTLVESSQQEAESDKLKKVNRFFNQLRFVDDIDHWKKSDYWATPVEMLATEGGDCEDFSIAKYFTLKELGVPESKMRLTYVKALKLNQAHMVLTYFPTPDAVPLVLDNLIPEILPATQRNDLLPVYSFNGTGLWLAKARGRGKRVGGSDRLELWRDLMTRMSLEGF